MTITAPEVALKGMSQTWTVDLSTDPQAGDVILIVATGANNSTPRTLNSVSGLGTVAGDWAITEVSVASQPSIHVAAYTAGADLTAGTITMTFSSSRFGIARVYLIRGMAGTPEVSVNLAAVRTSGTSSLSGPSVAVDAGDIIVNVLVDNTTVANTTWNTTGWTFDPQGALEQNASPVHSAGSVYRIPTGPATVSTSATTSASANLRIGSIRVRSGIGSTTGTLAATLPALTSDIAGLTTLTGQVAGILPELTAAVGGTVTRTGDVAATLPELTAALVGVVVHTGQVTATLPALEADVLGTSDNTVLGDVTATLPALGVAIAGDAVTTGEIVATLPGLSAVIDGDVPTTDTTGTLAATLPALTAAIVVDTGEAPLAGWDVERTGRALVGVDTTPTDLYVPGAVVDPPGHVTPVPLIRNSYQLANLTDTHRVHTTAEQEAGQTREDLGVPHIWVDGVDRTYDEDGELLSAENLVSEKGLGDRSATIGVKRQQMWHQNGDGAYAWLRPAAQVEVGIVTPTGARIVQWAGDLISDDATASSSSFDATWLAQGPLVQAMQAMHQPLDRMDPTDIGVVIPRVLNAVLSRRYPRIPTVRTGIMTTKLGAYGQRVGDYVRMLLATAWVGDRQWQLYRSDANPRQYRLQLTNTASIHWDVTAGAPGVVARLSEDWSTVENVIYGRGSLKSGHRWMNRRYPYLLPYAPPAYFSGDTSAELLLGTTDADTTNNGVTLYTQRLRELGYRVSRSSVILAEHVAATRELQRERGLTVDGRVGGQTWTSVWSIGATGADLRSVRLPLAADPRVEPWLYLPNGAIAEANPAYDPTWPRMENDIDYGENTTLAQGKADASQRVSRLQEPATIGTLTLSTCPWQGSRWRIKPGQNLTLHGWRGGDVVLHVADVTANRKAGTVTLTVDSAFRDALTVHEVRQRKAESKGDPGRRPGAIGRTRGSSAPDMVVPFDGESPAGIVPELTIRGGKWTVWPVAVDKVGTLAKIVARTYDPVTRFGILLFGREVNPAQLNAGVGNILTQSRPWASTGVEAFLDRFGFVEGWGQDGEACGYFPGSEQDGDPVTGKFQATSGVSYVSELPPFLWFCVIAAADTRITAELDPKPVT